MWMTELGIHHYKVRAYHPRLGRFMQTDPIREAGGINLYGYVGNDPVNGTDTTGLSEDVSRRFAAITEETLRVWSA
jgi:RHS repeat-associated protein